MRANFTQKSAVYQSVYIQEHLRPGDKHFLVDAAPEAK